MLKKILLTVAVGALYATFDVGTAQAQEPSQAPSYMGDSLPWHNSYYDSAWGQPYALVVPPTCGMQTQYGWGVGGTRTLPIMHQYRRPYPGDGGSSAGFRPTPYWPSDTNQFGVYYIRGPW